MPLFSGKSKKTFDKNLHTELAAGKPQPQALAIAYSVKRKAPKKKASGGTVESGSRDMNMAEGGSVSASNEKRPMPDNRYNDAKMASQNSSRKDNAQSGWTDKPTERQAVSNNGRMVKPIARPKMVPTNAFSTRLYDEEADLQSSDRPGPYGEKPPSHDNEEGPDRQGPKVRDMQDEHSTHRKPYAKGGEIEMSDEHPHANKYEDDLLDLTPSEDEGAMMADSHNEVDADGHGDPVPDMEDEHSTGRKPYAGGGRIGDALNNIHDELDLNSAHDKHSADDSEMQPEDEEEMEHHDSIAAAIMAKKDREAMHGADSDSDIDHEMMMAEGGRIHSKGSWGTHEDVDQADLSRNADEDANEEDQMSFGALRKENYSESEGLDQLDQPHDSNLHGDSEEKDSENKHDMVSRIMAKMNQKRQFPKR